MKSWDQQNYLVIRGFCYIRPLYNEVPLYQFSERHFVNKGGASYIGCFVWGGKMPRCCAASEEKVRSAGRPRQGGGGGGSGTFFPT